MSGEGALIAASRAPNDWRLVEVNYDQGYIETRFIDGAVCRGSHRQGSPERDQEYAETARRAGYGTDVRCMAVENDLLHTFLSERAGMPFSPALWGTAHNRWWPGWEQEEAWVFGLQCLLHDGDPEQWHLEQLAVYVKWARPKTTIEGLIEEARGWLNSRAEVKKE